MRCPGSSPIRTSMRLSRARSFFSVSTHMFCSSSMDSLAMDAGTLAPALPAGLALAMVAPAEEGRGQRLVKHSHVTCSGYFHLQAGNVSDRDLALGYGGE